MKTAIQELNVNAFRITNRLGKIILTISWKDYQSCFRLMERLHWDFDFKVYKKNNKYIIEL